MSTRYEPPIHDVIVLLDEDQPRAATLITRFADDHWIKTAIPKPEYL